MIEEIPITGNKDEIVSEKSETNNIKSIINTFSNKTETGISDTINNSFSSLTASDKDILREMALAERAISIALKYTWAMMK